MDESRPPSKLDKALDHWKLKLVGLFASSWFWGTYYMNSGSDAAGLMASGANVLLLGILIAVPARAIYRRAQKNRPSSGDGRPVDDGWRR